jgi:phosphoribosylanthranilate isomerase
MPANMNIRMKVCGMRERDNIASVSELRPDYMGFIFYKDTPRYVGDEFSISSDFPSEIKRVGVFVNEGTEVILRYVEQFGLDLVQLHGNEPAGQCAELKSNGVGVIKVFAVGEDVDFGVTKAYAPHVDFFLFDTRGKYFGGNSKTFNWDVLQRYEQTVPFFLSGGINPINAREILDLHGLNLHAVDINSGVEIRPALKDINKIKEIRSILNIK